MDVYIYRADIYCEDCGERLCRERLPEIEFPRETNSRDTGFRPDDETTYDSDYYPKGPYPGGGGESDSPVHCGDCGVYIGAPLTQDGAKYVVETVRDVLREILTIEGQLSVGNKPVITDTRVEWADDLKHYALTQDQNVIMEMFDAAVREREGEC